ncbi:MAG TPA: sigma-70 family RNA polymerase sigma factor [Ignavibacteria bacterium]
MLNSKREYKSFTDEQLIGEFKEGNNDAYSEIVIRYKDRLVNFLFRYTGNKDDSEDLAQDAFIKLYRSKHLYQEIAKFSTWFYTIAINIAKTSLKKKSRMSTLSISDYDPENDKDFDIPAATIEPDVQANASIENEYIQKAINSLEETYREAIILRDIQDLDYEEIANTLNVPIGTVKSRINRGREKLKVLLKDIYKPSD